MNDISMLEEQICLKNEIINSFALTDKAGQEKIKVLKYELDDLLYRYYKSYRLNSDKVFTENLCR